MSGGVGADVIKGNPLITDWLRKVSATGYGSWNTERNHVYRMGKFLNDVGLTPDELLQKAKDGELERVVENWIIKKRSEGLGQGSIGCYVATLKSFCKAHKADLDIKLKVGRPRPRRLPSKEELEKLFEVAPLRVRAFLLFMRDSGLAPVDILNLTYGDIRAELESGKIPLAITAVRKKTGIPFVTFLGGEAVKCLKLYLDERKAEGEVLTDKSPLFALRGKKKGRPISYAGISWMVKEAREKVGLSDFDVYDLRRYFATQLRSSGLNEAFVESWMGHDLGTNNGYFRPSLEEQRKQYEAHYSALAFEEDVESLKAKVRELTDEREALIRKIRELESRQGEFERTLMLLVKGQKRKKRGRKSAIDEVLEML